MFVFLLHHPALTRKKVCLERVEKMFSWDLVKTHTKARPAVEYVMHTASVRSDRHAHVHAHRRKQTKVPVATF